MFEVDHNHNNMTFETHLRKCLVSLTVTSMCEGTDAKQAEIEDIAHTNSTSSTQHIGLSMNISELVYPPHTRIHTPVLSPPDISNGSHIYSMISPIRPSIEYLAPHIVFVDSSISFGAVPSISIHGFKKYDMRKSDMSMT